VLLLWQPLIKNDGKKVWRTWQREGAFFESARASCAALQEAVFKGTTKPRFLWLLGCCQGAGVCSW